MLSSLVSPIALLAVILVIAFGLMLTNRVRPDVVAIGVALALGLTGVIQPDDIFAGFSRSAVITIIGIFILAQGLQRTGVTRSIGRALTRVNHGGERSMVGLVMSIGAGLSLFMNNIAAAAVLLPGVVEAVRRLRLMPSKIMIPLAFATSLGGMATLLTTGNIVVSAGLMEAGYRGYGLLDFTPVGVPVAIVGIVFMLLVGLRLLPARNPSHMDSEMPDGESLSEEYELRQRMNEVRVPRSSPLAHRPISQSGIGKEYGLSVMAVRRGNTTILAPAPSAVIEPDDVLLIVGRRERVEELIQCDALAAYDGNNGFDDDLISEDVSLVEVMLGPRSRAVGQTLKELRFRDKFNATVLALWHGGRSVRTDLADLPLQFGDSMLVYGSRDAIRLLQSDADFLVLRVPQKADEAPIRASKATLAIIIMAISLLIAAAGLIPIAEAVMLGSLVMVLTGCLTMDEAYRAIDWRAIFLIAGMLPVSLAMTETGAAALLGNAIVSSLSRFGPVAIGAGLLLAATALTQVMSGQVTAVVLTPIAISAAQLIGSDPRGMAMYVALGSSLAFITPTAHVVNVFVMGAGGYAASDYPRVGLPLTAILFVVIVVLVALVWKI